MNEVRTRKSLVPEGFDKPASKAEPKKRSSMQTRIWVLGGIVVVMLGIVAYRTFFSTETPQVEPQPAVEPPPQPPAPDQPQPGAPAPNGQTPHRTIMSG